ncbi:carboxymuconolactone decarboxylase family protein [Oceanicola sp. 22II-s10i]|uniref:carboxymuconolactone decarboxylase family protein n=1 Tax=Oceanicola sp. 22II-s10i TaxID=1317116 RepID=UPI00159528CB|nr:carboxymuconolactone decarboxylase family protein [Oceanicola sp. 22II-s10i]
MTQSERFTAGLAIFAEMFGEERARMRAGKSSPEDTRLGDLLMDFAYGDVWANPVFTRRERSLMTIALLAGIGRQDELEAHLGAALANGCTEEELYEAMIHVILYCGFPAGISGHRTVKKVLASRDDMASSEP